MPALILLNNLADAGYLSGGLFNIQGGRWRQVFVAALEALLGTLRDSSLVELDDRRKLGQLLRLLSNLLAEGHHFAPTLAALLDQRIAVVGVEDVDVQQRGWRHGGAWNDAHLLGLLLRSAERLASNVGVEEILKNYLLKREYLKQLLRGFHWNREIMKGLAGFMEMWKADLRWDLLRELATILKR